MAIPDANLAPLRFDPSTWDELETVFGDVLNEDHRAEIIEAVDQFVVASHFRAVDDERGKLRGSKKRTTSVRKMRGRIGRVLNSWQGKRDKIGKHETEAEKAEKDAKEARDAQTMRRLLEDVSDDLGLGDIAETMEHLHHINRHLDRYLSAPQYNSFPRYVARIKAVFEGATGKPVRVAIPTETSHGPSQFVTVMMTLDRILPPQARRKNDPTDAAWSQAVRRAIHDTGRG